MSEQTLDLLAVYRKSRVVRRFEERAAELRRGGDIVCSLHLCIGQEQIAVAALAALTDEDVVFGTYRGHHWALACGAPLDTMFAEFLGREGGINGGRAGAGLLLAPEHGFLGENGIVGGSLPMAAGAALASKYDGTSRISLVAFGDGALNQGAVHEAMNFAAVFDLGVVFLCENNGYAEFTPTAEMFRIGELWQRASAYGFPGEAVDGTDPVAVHAAVSRAARRARAGEGPTLIEARAKRLEGHHTHDPEHYRPDGERDAWRLGDPLMLLRRRMADELGESELQALDAEIETQMETALEWAMASPPADPGSVLEHVHG